MTSTFVPEANAGPLRAIMVCVDYSDELAITLPWNRHHFQEMMVVTSWKDYKTRRLCHSLDVRVYETDAFYEDGARFNKWKALEEALDHYVRHGWLCVLDADVLWPKELKGALDELRVGKLYGPLRRMYPRVPANTEDIPSEASWSRYPLHGNVREWAGYSQIFHASDPVLGAPPWHEINWIHAGGADSFFQLKWKDTDKIRPAFEVLHLGEAGVNWAGRGEAEKAELRRLLLNRRGKSGSRRFDSEKL